MKKLVLLSLAAICMGLIAAESADAQDLGVVIANGGVMDPDMTNEE